MSFQTWLKDFPRLVEKKLFYLQSWDSCSVHVYFHHMLYYYQSPTIDMSGEKNPDKEFEAHHALHYIYNF